MSVGQTIEKLRKKRQFTQAKLATEAGISQNYISAIEKDKKDPTVSTLHAIAKALEIPLPILFFLSLNETDIPSNKKKLFTLVQPLIARLLEE